MRRSYIERFRRKNSSGEAQWRLNQDLSEEDDLAGTDRLRRLMLSQGYS
jgi:hypothetical protein